MGRGEKRMESNELERPMYKLTEASETKETGGKGKRNRGRDATFLLPLTVTPSRRISKVQLSRPKDWVILISKP